MLDREQPEPITSRLLDESCAGTAIRHGFFTRRGGVSKGIYEGLNVGLGSHDERAHVVENRTRVCGWFPLPTERLATPHQIHSSDVIIIDQNYDGARPKGDAMVTGTPGILVGVLTADCGPVLMADPQAGVVAAAHAGWRGAIDGILENTIDVMEQCGARRDRITACVGPSISGPNYEVGPEFVDRFVRDNAENGAYFTPSANESRSNFDLQSFILDRLAGAGITAQQSGQCTYADESMFYSYRRTTHRGESDYGRQISAIGIVDGGSVGPAF
ncbi:peptidoglycan editing factor PgeF [Hoeflea sp.]|uniref:peptidoglycan editing factor PgeF n=1 Tax=Hoeflea sp. TaxID=1940281 RepID=UPI003B02B572